MLIIGLTKITKNIFKTTAKHKPTSPALRFLIIVIYRTMAAPLLFFLILYAGRVMQRSGVRPSVHPFRNGKKFTPRTGTLVSVLFFGNNNCRE